MVAHTVNPSIQEAEAGGSLWFQGQPGLQSKFQDSQSYTEKLCLKKLNQPTKQQQQQQKKNKMKAKVIAFTQLK